MTDSAQFGDLRTSGRDLPSPLACYIEAVAKYAGQAVQAGDLEEALGLLEAALRAINQTGQHVEQKHDIAARENM